MHFHSLFKYPKMTRTHILFYGVIHNTHQRMGYTGAWYTFIDKMPQVFMKEIKEQTVGGILRQRQEAWVFSFNLRQKCPLEIQFMGDRYIMEH